MRTGAASDAVFVDHGRRTPVYAMTDIDPGAGGANNFFEVEALGGAGGDERG
jgi:hypothetical protein